MAENGAHKSGMGFTTMLQVICLIAGLGVAYGALKNEVDTLKRTQIDLAVSQAVIIDKLNQIEMRLIRLESGISSDRKRGQR